MDTQDDQTTGRALRTVVTLVRMMGPEEIKEVEKEVIERMQVLGCESDLASAKERDERSRKAVQEYRKRGGPKKGGFGPWEKRVESIDEDALADGKGFRALGGAFLRKGEQANGCVLQYLTTGDYVALKDGIVLASTNDGEQAGFTGRLAGVNTHPHARVIWALWKELRK